MIAAIAIALAISTAIEASEQPISVVRPLVQIVEIRDITFDVPYFDNAPRFNLNDSLNGRNVPFGEPRETTTRNRHQNEEKLMDILSELYGDEYDMILWNGHIIYRKIK